MKSFQQFIIETELRDKEGLGGGTGMTHRGGEKIGSERKKTAPEKKRVKAVGGGKTAPAKDYKPRKDIGKQRPKSEREQQPEKARGSAALSPREAQRKAAMERRAAKKGAKTKTASQLLSKGNKSQTDPNNPKYKPDSKYKPTGKPGHTGTSKKSYSEKERKALYKKGERTLRDIVLKATGKKSEKELKHKITSK
tara:strand:+ start:43 stop:627 length:585 start_codon:yes stop_codon:yes gene_type:complete